MNRQVKGVDFGKELKFIPLTNEFAPNRSVSHASFGGAGGLLG